MHDDGIALFINPKRGNSMSNFIELAQKQGFSVKLNKFEDEKFIEEQ